MSVQYGGQRSWRAASFVTEVVLKRCFMFNLTTRLYGRAKRGGFVKKILAIDDQAEVINIIADFLEEKYEVYAAKTTARAFSLLHTTKFDLILLDILLAGMNGIEFLEYAQKQIWYEKTPVIFVSSESDYRTVAQAVSLGVDGYIKKPIEKEVLLAKIKTVIGE
jgi:PleD family two-component response regulator